MFSTNDLEQLMQKVDEQGWGILSLPQSFCQSLLQRFNEVEFSGLLKKADVTKNDQPQEIRNDFTYWLDSQQSAAEGELFVLLQLLRDRIKNYFRIPLNDLECHFALYPAGHYYKKHVDQTATNNKRFFSFVIYLNSEWSATDGGQLVGFDAETAKPLFTLLPEAGKMVIFRSDIPHEVEVCHKPRKSIAGWLRT